MATGTRRAREIENLRRAILDAARELFYEQDYRAVSMRKIAEKVEYSPAAIYRYFSDKEEILFHLIDEGFQQLNSRFKDLAGVADPLERMRLGGKAYTEFALTQPHYYRLMFQLERNEMMEKYMPQCTNAYEAFGFVIHAVQEAMDMGVFKQDLPAVVVAASIWAGLHGAISLSLTGHLHIMMPPENDMMLYEHVAEGLLRQNLLKTT